MLCVYFLMAVAFFMIAHALILLLLAVRLTTLSLDFAIFMYNMQTDVSFLAFAD